MPVETDFEFKKEHPIFLVAHMGDLSGLKKIIDNDPQLIEMRTDKEESPLDFAAAGGRIEIVKWLLEKNNVKSTEQQQKEKDGALLIAAFFGQLSMVKWLLEAGISQLSARDSLGMSALLYAADNFHLDVVKWLLKEGGSQISEHNDAGQSALMLAVIHRDLATVKWLLEEGGSKLLEHDNRGQTALNYAADTGDDNMVSYLVNHPQMTYQALKGTVVTNKHSQSIIKNKIQAYESLLEEADSDEACLDGCKVCDDKLLVANYLFCPISHELMTEPVMAADGHLYDKCNIERWLKEKNTSPLTGEHLGCEILFPAHDCKRIVDAISASLNTLYHKSEEKMKDRSDETETTRKSFKDAETQTTTTLSELSLFTMSSLHHQQVKREVQGCATKTTGI